MMATMQMSLTTTATHHRPIVVDSSDNCYNVLDDSFESNANDVDHNDITARNNDSNNKQTTHNSNDVNLHDAIASSTTMTTTMPMTQTTMKTI